MRNEVQQYRDNGITDTGKISTAMKVAQETGLSAQELSYAMKLADNIGKSGWNDPKIREDYKNRYKDAIPGTNGEKIWNSIENFL